MIYTSNNLSPVAPADIEERIRTRPTGAGEYLGAVTVDSFNNSLPGVAASELQMPYDDVRVDPAQRPGRAPPKMVRSDETLLDHDSWLTSPYYRKEIPFDNRMTEARAKFKADQYDADQFRRYLRDNRANGVGTAALAITGALLGSAPDPTNYIPIFGPAFKVAAAGRAANIFRRATVGALDAAIVTAAVQPTIVQSRHQFGDDISFADSVIDIAVGAALGGVFGGAVGWRERLGPLRADRVSEAVATLHLAANDVADGRALDVGTLRPEREVAMRSAVDEIDPAPVLNSKGQAVAPTVRANQNFKAWFGGSKVVDEAGAPLVVYHGTDETFDAFDPAKSGSAHGAESAQKGLFFTSKSEVADQYAGVTAGANVQPVYLKMENPMIEDFSVTGPGKSITEKIDIAKAQGHDGLIIKNIHDGTSLDNAKVSDLHVAFDPTQIKSAIGNSGAFDPNSRSLTDYTPTPPDSPAVTAQEATAADQRVTSRTPPTAQVKAQAEEQGIDPTTGEFAEMVELQNAITAGSIKLHPAEAAALREADQALARSEDYKTAFETYAACLVRKGS